MEEQSLEHEGSVGVAIRNGDSTQESLSEQSDGLAAELYKWILERYANPKALLAVPARDVLDGLARYVAETFRRQIVVTGRFD